MYESIPQELKDLKNWVGWKLIDRDGKPTKIPYSVYGGTASSTDSKTWASFEDVEQIPPTNDSGIGFVFDGNGIIGIDIDHCVKEDGTLTADAKSILDAFPNTYAEISPSGTGLHIFIRCDEQPYEKGKHGKIVEVYSSGRYFTTTGSMWATSKQTIATFDSNYIKVTLEPFLPPDLIPIKPIVKTQSVKNSICDYEICRMASNAKNGSKFDALMRGSTSDYGGDKSRADMALASILAFYTDDENQIERIMRTSGLVRDKWNRVDYIRDMTIRKSISSCIEHFNANNTEEYINHGSDVARAFCDKNEVSSIDKKNTENKTNNIVGITQNGFSDEEWANYVKQAKDGSGLPQLPELPDGIFKDYVDIGVSTSYSHKSYHFGALLTLSTMLFKRKVCVQAGIETIYPNLFTFVSGLSTVSGKSSACNAVLKRFESVIIQPMTVGDEPITKLPAQDNISPNIKVITGTMSEAAVIQTLSATSNILWTWDDAGAFFDGIETWNSAMLPTLCSIYDCNKIQRTLSSRGKKNGEENGWKCDNPFTSILFNMTIGDLQNHLNMKIKTSGFLPRVLWFVELGGRRRPNSDVPDEIYQKLERIRKGLMYIESVINKLPVECNVNNRITPPVIFKTSNNIENWCTRMSNSYIDKYGENCDDDILTAMQRGMIHAYKLAMIFSMFDEDIINIIKMSSKYPVELLIPEKYELFAINIVSKYLIPRTKFVAELCSAAAAQNSQRVVLQSIDKRNRRATKSEIIRDTRLKKAELKDALDQLLFSGEVIEKTIQNTNLKSKRDLTQYIHVCEEMEDELR